MGSLGLLGRLGPAGEGLVGLEEGLSALLNLPGRTVNLSDEVWEQTGRGSGGLELAGRVWDGEKRA